jgi:Tol biopolymer transport system component
MFHYGFAFVSTAVFVCAPSFGQTTTRESIASNGTQGNGNGGSWGIALSADGRYVAFGSEATNLVPGGTPPLTNEVFRRDRLTRTTSLVSATSSGVPGAASSYAPAISADGRFVAFQSDASNLVAGDTNDSPDIFVHDFRTGQTTRVSVDSNGAQANGGSLGPSISADGRFVAFWSSARNLVRGDSNGSGDVFVHDMCSGSTTRVDVGSLGNETNNASGDAPAISADGRYVAFDSHASNLVLGDTNGAADIFVHDLRSGTTTRVSVDSSGVQAGGGGSYFPSISADGRFVAFQSYAYTLVPGDTNDATDVFVHDRRTGVTKRISVDSAGAEGNGSSVRPSISADGRYVAFISFASNLVPGDTNEVNDVFVHDLRTGVTTRASVGFSGVQANGDSFGSAPSISADGRRVAFGSGATNLVAGDTNGVSDTFVRDLDGLGIPFCSGDGSSGAPSCPCGNNGQAGHGCDNSAASGGAVLGATGMPSLAADSAQFTSSSELPTALSIVFEGDAVIDTVNFGDGLRCAGGNLHRLYMKIASDGVVAAPGPGDPSISMQSATLGDPIAVGATRLYQVYYRDPSLAFCLGGFNATNGIAITWSE